MFGQNIFANSSLFVSPPNPFGLGAQPTTTFPQASFGIPSTQLPAFGQTSFNMQPAQITEKKAYEVIIDDAQRALVSSFSYDGNDYKYENAKLYFAYADAILEKLECTEAEFGESLREILTKNKAAILCLPNESEDSKNEQDTDQIIKKSKLDKKSDSKKSKQNIKLGLIKKAAKGSVPSNPFGDNPEESESEDENKEDAMESEKMKKLALDLEEQRLRAEKPTPVYKDDLQIAWECLEAARLITENQITKIDQKENQTDYNKCKKALGIVRMRLGDVLIMKGDNTKAIKEYDEALKLLKENKKENLKELASLYWSMGIFEEKNTKFIQKARHIIEKMICEITNQKYEKLLKDKTRPELLQINPLNANDANLQNLVKTLTFMYEKVFFYCENKKR